MPMLPDDIAMGPVALAVRDLDRAVTFYERVLGLVTRRREGAAASLGTTERDLLHLRAHPNGRRDPDAAGLFHFALLLPSRAALGRHLRHLAEIGVALDGAADHHVSEAIYLSDPDGHGIELYRDRPREKWEVADGRVRLVNAPLDRAGLLEAGDAGAFAGIAPETVMGHVHLETRDLAASGAFYRERLGFETMAEWPGRALFLAKGGYHHHLALNRFHGRTEPLRRGPEVIGLLSFEILLPDATSLAAFAEAFGQRNDVQGAVVIEDPSGVPIRLRAF